MVSSATALVQNILKPDRDESFELCRGLCRRLIGLRMRTVVGLTWTLSPYLGSRFVETKEMSK